ncbi:MAG TPA: homoserine O-succinyltransferase [Gemmatimonadaceae bacterium]|jgi:homoserine O-acetyltransferase|nr:homoserine O-succinyltransferase [Gemmatimonadaceae bacterium]
MTAPTLFSAATGSKRIGVEQELRARCCVTGDAPLENSFVPYEINGAAGAPVVAVLGGISASRHVGSSASDLRAGWWEDVVGNGRAIDTTKLRVISIDYLSRSPEKPPVTTEDQARALAAALDHAEIDRLHAIVGASYGGMVALAFAAAFPRRAGRVIAISAAHESDPMSTALRHLQRRVVELGASLGRERDALSIARGIAITSYLTPAYFEERVNVDGEYDARSAEDRIGRYLKTTGEKFADTWTSDRYNSLSLSLDLHSVQPERITVPTTVIAVSSDRLVPIAQSRELARRLSGPSQLIELDSPVGHDAFLGDWRRVAPFITELLQLNAEAIS